MSHKLNFEPGSSREILELRRLSKVIEHQRGSVRELPLGDRSDDYMSSRKEKLTYMVYQCLLQPLLLFKPT